jgi:transcriptional regulator with XRE-family HTH domain
MFMWEIGERLREQRKRAKINVKDAAASLNISKSYISMLESGDSKPNWELLAGLATLYGVSADYLLGIVDDPQPVRGEDLPPTVREIVHLAVEWPPTRQQELLDHAHVLDRAQQRAANLSEYDSLMAMFAAAEDGPELVAMLEDLLRAVDAGDAATAQRLWARILAGRGVTAKQRPQQAPQQG